MLELVDKTIAFRKQLAELLVVGQECLKRKTVHRDLNSDDPRQLSLIVGNGTITGKRTLNKHGLVVVPAYDTYMEVIIDAQLEMENLARDVETSRITFTKP